MLRDILAPFAGRIEQVGLFGSRSRGGARPESDIDLVVYGPLTAAEIGRLWTLFDESALPLRIDVVGYAQTAGTPIRARIDAEMRPLFSQADLMANAVSHRS